MNPPKKSFVIEPLSGSSTPDEGNPLIQSQSTVSGGKLARPAREEPVFLAIGKLRRAHGVRGEMLMEIFSDFPERIRPGIKVFIGEDHEPHTLQSTRAHNDGLIVGFEAYQTPEAIAPLRNQWVYVQAEDRPPLPEGDFYYHQVIGLAVEDENGVDLGIVTDILETGANDVLVVKSPDQKEILLPVTEEVVLKIDLNRGKLRAHLLPGL